MADAAADLTPLSLIGKLCSAVSQVGRNVLINQPTCKVVLVYVHDNMICVGGCALTLLSMPRCSSRIGNSYLASQKEFTASPAWTMPVAVCLTHVFCMGSVFPRVRVDVHNECSFPVIWELE